MTKEYLTMDDFDFKGRTVLLRVDVNSPYDERTGKISDSERIKAHAETIRELSDEGAKVVVLGHQGRKGNPDFTSLKQHSQLLSKHVGKEVRFVGDVIGEEAQRAVKTMRNGEITLLDNVRLLDEETKKLPPQEHEKGQLVKALAPLADIFVNDAFSVSHRSHASIVGFTRVLPSAAGRVMERELASVDKVWDPRGGNVFLLGGAKPDDCLNIAQHVLATRPKAVEQVLSCGILGQIFLLAQGHTLGKPTEDFMEKKNFLSILGQAREVVEKYSAKISVPLDVAANVGGRREEIPLEKLPVDAMIMDIGEETARRYGGMLRKANAAVLKGPPGVYEDRNFQKGSKIVFESAAASKGFSLVGGGDTLSAIKALDIDYSKFGYVSLAGGALITYLSGKTLPGLAALAAAKRRWCLGRLRRPYK